MFIGYGVVESINFLILFFFFPDDVNMRETTTTALVHRDDDEENKAVTPAFSFRLFFFENVACVCKGIFFSSFFFSKMLHAFAKMQHGVCLAFGCSVG